MRRDFQNEYSWETVSILVCARLTFGRTGWQEGRLLFILELRKAPVGEVCVTTFIPTISVNTLRRRTNYNNEIRFS